MSYEYNVKDTDSQTMFNALMREAYGTIDPSFGYWSDLLHDVALIMSKREEGKTMPFDWIVSPYGSYIRPPESTWDRDDWVSTHMTQHSGAMQFMVVVEYGRGRNTIHAIHDMAH